MGEAQAGSDSDGGRPHRRSEELSELLSSAAGMPMSPSCATWSCMRAISGEITITVMLAGRPDKIDDFEALMRAYEIVELQRTGRVALPRLERQAPRLHSVKGA